MGSETLKMPSPEEMAKIQTERVLSDAELIRGGAKYILDKNNDLILDITEEQKDEAKEEMNTSESMRIYKNADVADKARYNALISASRAIACLESMKRVCQNLGNLSKFDTEKQEKEIEQFEGELHNQGIDLTNLMISIYNMMENQGLDVSEYAHVVADLELGKKDFSIALKR